MASLVQRYIVEDAAKASAVLPAHIALVNPDGTPYAATGEPGPKGDTGPKGPKGDAGAAGPRGAAGVGVKSLALTADKDGHVSGGTLTLTDGTTQPVAVTQA